MHIHCILTLKLRAVLGCQSQGIYENCATFCILCTILTRCKNKIQVVHWEYFLLQWLVCHCWSLTQSCTCTCISSTCMSHHKYYPIPPESATSVPEMVTHCALCKRLPPTRTLPLCVLTKKAGQTCIHTLRWREGGKPPCQHTWEHVTAAQPRPEGLTAAVLHAHMNNRPLYVAEPKFQGLQCVFTKETVAWGKQGNGVYRPRPGCPPDHSRHH